MGVVVAILSLVLIVLILVDSFETIVLPRRVTHRFRFARLFYRSTWTLWRTMACRLSSGKSRESHLSLFGPSSVLGLLAVWVLGLILSFAMLYWSFEVVIRAPEDEAGFWTYLYMSGVTFFTLGYGDVVPTTPFGRALAVSEAGLGFGFLAVIISYLPVIYQVFSQREMIISLLDARAGSPPSAATFMLRLTQLGGTASVESFLAECERWSAVLLESHLSFPVLAYYRSQHDNQSWLSTLTAILDTCAFLIVAVKDHHHYQAKLTFAIARHTAVDLALIFKTPPVRPEPNRLPDEQLFQLAEALSKAGLSLHESKAIAVKLAELRAMYEPFVNALAQQFMFTLPPFAPSKPGADNWQRSAWLERAPDIERLPIASSDEDHFS